MSELLAKSVPNTTEAGKSDVSITTSNVHSLTTYDIRQELVRRDCLDIPEEKINHNSMLQRLIVALLKDEEKQVEEATEAAVDKAALEREKAKAIREQRKREAIERSKARQANPEYFQRLKEDNEKGKDQVEGKTVAASDCDHKDKENEGQEEEANDVDDDPFRTTKSTGRSKLGGAGVR